MKTLVIGYGNTLRCDDGVGIHVAQAIEKEGFDGVEVRTCQQLHMDLVSEFGDYDRIILADASVDGEEVEMRKIRPTSQNFMASSHHLGPELLLRLSEITHFGEPELYLCMVRGRCFDYGDQLSEEAKGRARSAIVKLKILLPREE